eukprot:snap_masked-scaffold_3-processed-gene-5.30-mRNA-1 protein AED:1.00 eAED:1.00 QI:0/0/0/0/1/1/3/0/98
MCPTDLFLKYYHPTLLSCIFWLSSNRKYFELYVAESLSVDDYSLHERQHGETVNNKGMKVQAQISQRSYLSLLALVEVLNHSLVSHVFLCKLIAKLKI